MLKRYVIASKDAECALGYTSGYAILPRHIVVGSEETMKSIKDQHEEFSDLFVIEYESLPKDAINNFGTIDVPSVEYYNNL